MVAAELWPHCLGVTLASGACTAGRVCCAGLSHEGTFHATGTQDWLHPQGTHEAGACLLPVGILFSHRGWRAVAHQAGTWSQTLWHQPGPSDSLLNPGVRS